jgi:hypothetical protein
MGQNDQEVPEGQALWSDDMFVRCWEVAWRHVSKPAVIVRCLLLNNVIELVEGRASPRRCKQASQGSHRIPVPALQRVHDKLQHIFQLNV